MKSITEEMRYRQRLCEYAKKNGVTKAARRYHTNRQFVYRQLEKYDGDVRSLALKSRKPHRSPNAHTEEELALIQRILKRSGLYGLAEVYVKCRKQGYRRSFGSMCRQIRKCGYQTRLTHRKSYTKYERMGNIQEIRYRLISNMYRMNASVSQVTVVSITKSQALMNTAEKEY